MIFAAAIVEGDGAGMLRQLFHHEAATSCMPLVVCLVVAALEVDVSKHGGAPFDFNTGFKKKTRRNEADVSFHPQISFKDQRLLQSHLRAHVPAQCRTLLREDKRTIDHILAPQVQSAIDAICAAYYFQESFRLVVSRGICSGLRGRRCHQRLLMHLFICYLEL